MTPVVWHLGPRSAALAERLAAALDGGAIRGPATTDLVQAFHDGRPIVAVAATGIVIRLLAPLLADKRHEPPVLVVDEAGRFVVSLLGGHRGANALAERGHDPPDLRRLQPTLEDAYRHFTQAKEKPSCSPGSN